MAPIVVDLSLSSDDDEDDVVCLPECPAHLASRAGKISVATENCFRIDSTPNGLCVGEDHAEDDHSDVIIHLHFDADVGRRIRRSSSQQRGLSYNPCRATARRNQRESRRGAQTDAQASALQRRLIMEDDDCCILEQDPTREESATSSAGDHSDDVVVTGEVGQVACRDFAHARHQCATFPFKKTSHTKFCPKCHCYVCDTLAPCKDWGDGSKAGDHCHATDSSSELWGLLRGQLKDQRQRRESSSGASGSGSSSVSGLSSTSGSNSSNADHISRTVGSTVRARDVFQMRPIPNNPYSNGPHAHYRPLPEPSPHVMRHPPTVVTHVPDHSVDLLRQQIGGTLLSREFSTGSMEGGAYSIGSSYLFDCPPVGNSGSFTGELNGRPNPENPPVRNALGTYPCVGVDHGGMLSRNGGRSQRRESYGTNLYQPYQQKAGRNSSSRNPERGLPSTNQLSQAPDVQQQIFPEALCLWQSNLQGQHQQQAVPRDNQQAVLRSHQQQFPLFDRQGGPRGHHLASPHGDHQQESTAPSNLQLLPGEQQQVVPRNSQRLVLHDLLLQAAARAREAAARARHEIAPVQHPDSLYQQPYHQQLPLTSHHQESSSPHHQQTAILPQQVSHTLPLQRSALIVEHERVSVASLPRRTRTPPSSSEGDPGHGSVSTVTAFHFENLGERQSTSPFLLGSVGSLHEGASVQDVYWNFNSPNQNENLLDQFDIRQNEEIHHQRSTLVGGTLDPPVISSTESEQNESATFHFQGPNLESYVDSLLGFESQVDREGIVGSNSFSPPNSADFLGRDNLWGD